MEKDSRVETSKKESKPRKSLLQKIKKKSHNEDDEEQQEIQLAFFHPAFEWGDSEEFNSPLNFEKRAPFPTINLLRAATIREYANQVMVA